MNLEASLVLKVLSENIGGGFDRWGIVKALGTNPDGVFKYTEKQVTNALYRLKKKEYIRRWGLRSWTITDLGRGYR
jgi:hypothetical protein